MIEGETMENVQREEKIIQVLDGFRILVESKNYNVQRLNTIDNRNSPKFKKGDEINIRQEWQDDNGYYGLTPSGLKLALKHILAQESIRRIEGEVNIGDYIKIIGEVAGQISKLVDDVMGSGFGEN